MYTCLSEYILKLDSACERRHVLSFSTPRPLFTLTPALDIIPHHSLYSTFILCAHVVSCVRYAFMFKLYSTCKRKCVFIFLSLVSGFDFLTDIIEKLS